MPTKSNFVDLWRKGIKLLVLQGLQASHWSTSGTAVMIKVTRPPATAVNQLNTSYFIDILVITFPKAHLCDIYFTLIMSNRKRVQYPKRIIKVLLKQVYSKPGVFPSPWSWRPSQASEPDRVFHVPMSLPYLAILRTHAHVLSTLIQANLIYLHGTLVKQTNKQANM